MQETGFIETTEQVSHDQLEGLPKPETAIKESEPLTTEQIAVHQHPYTENTNHENSKNPELDKNVKNDDAERTAKVQAALHDPSQQLAFVDLSEVESIKIPKEEIAPLVGPLAKIRKAIIGTTKKDLEKMERLYYTQEGLLQLVKMAEEEARKIAKSNYKPEEDSSSSQEHVDDAIDINALNEEEQQLNVALEANEARFSELIDKENSGKLTNDEVSELILIWKKRGEIEKSLEMSLHKQKSYSELMREKMTGVLDRSLKAMWRSFNARSGINGPLAELQTIAIGKARKLGKTDLSISQGTTPSDLAGMITQLQIDSLRKMPTTKSNVALAA